MATQLSDLKSEIDELRQRLDRVEAEIAALRVNGNAVVARYEIEGEEYIVTQADIDRVKAETAEEGPIDDTPDKVWETMALSQKLAERHKDQPREIRYTQSLRNFEAMRAKAIAEGKGIDDEYKIANGD
jgi:hypothetical protein